VVNLYKDVSEQPIGPVSKGQAVRFAITQTCADIIYRRYHLPQISSTADIIYRRYHLPQISSTADIIYRSAEGGNC